MITPNKTIKLERIEDGILSGAKGTKGAIKFLESLRDMLSGHANTKVDVTTDWKGGLTVYTGINPETQKFFITTDMFRDVCYTDEDIDAKYTDKVTAKKLKIAIRYLPKLGMTNIMKGDIMFVKGDVKNESIDGVSYVTFQPGDVVYAFPSQTKLAGMVSSAQIGIVFSASYTGTSMNDVEESLNVDLGQLNLTKDVWFRDSSYVDVTGTATFTKDETEKLNELLSSIDKQFQSISHLYLNRIAAIGTIRKQIRKYNEVKIGPTGLIAEPDKHARDLIYWVEASLNREILDAKMAPTKKNRIMQKNELMRFYRGNGPELTKIFKLRNDMVIAKNMLFKKLQQIKQATSTFTRTDSGYKVVAPDGFVAVDRLSGNAVKLIDRMEFSQQDFTTNKNWIT
jgi:hypothetical protein